MAEFFTELFSNKMLISAGIAWTAAQVIKFIIDFWVNKKMDAERLFGPGGMPSSHSAAVCALCVSAAKIYGPASPYFAISLVLALVVMHDARGVRLQAGYQAQVLNRIIASLKEQGNKPFEDVELLKEIIGHTPFQVHVGGIIGIITALIFS